MPRGGLAQLPPIPGIALFAPAQNGASIDFNPAPLLIGEGG